eukprot:scaffold19465_cov92-Isochrysis_galbana.AAC.3
MVATGVGGCGGNGRATPPWTEGSTRASPARALRDPTNASPHRYQRFPSLPLCIPLLICSTHTSARASSSGLRLAAACSCWGRPTCLGNSTPQSAGGLSAASTFLCPTAPRAAGCSSST